MSLTITATAGSATANSYVTLAEADAYFEASVAFNATWTAMTDAEQTQRAVSATRAIDRFEYRSNPVTETQALRFPVEDQDDTTVIPQKVKDATCEMVMHQYRVQSGTTGQASRDIDSVDVDGVVAVTFSRELSESEEFATGANIPSVEALLARWIWSSGRLEIVR